MLKSLSKEDKLAGDHERGSVPSGPADNHSQYLKRCMTSLILFIYLSFSPCAISQAVPASRILVLNSYHKGFPWTDNIVSGIESVLDREKIGADLVIEYMDSKAVKYDITYKTELYKLYSHKYSRQKFDVIISSDDNAFNFLREYRKEIFPDTPVVFCGVNNLEAPNLISRDHFTGILEIAAEKETLDIALKLHPETKQVVIVMDTTPSGRYRWSQLEPVFVQYPDIIFTRIDDSFSISEIEDRMKKLSDDTIAFFATLYRDKTGRYISLAEGTSRISKSSRRPIYTFHTQVLQHGTIGGKLLGGRQHGVKSAEMAIRILQGEKVANIPIADHSIAQYIFDYQQLKRFGIKSSDLPEESIIVNIPFSFYKEYKTTVWATTLVVLVLAIIIIMLNLNIAKRKRVEETLLESEERMRSVLENSPVGISIYDETGQCFVANDSIAEMIGATKEQVLQQNYNEIESWKISGTLDKAKSAVKENISKRHELIGESTFGQTVCLDCYLVPFSSGRLLFMAHDITEQKQAEEALRFERNKVTNIMDSMQDGVYIVNRQYDIEYVNPVLKKEFGAVEGRRCYEYFHNRQEVCPWCKNPEVFAGKTVRWEWYSPKNQKTYDLIDTPLKNPDGSIISKLEMFRDITEHKQAEEELKKYRDHLEKLVEDRTNELKEKTDKIEESRKALTYLVEDVNEAQKELEKANESLKELDYLESMFIASMSHELRTPLNSIIGFTGIILQGLTGEINAEQKDQLQRVSGSAKHLLNLITDIIDISKIEAGKVEVYAEEVNLNGVIKEAVSSLKPEIDNKGIGLEISLLSDLQLKTDRKRLLQCILNYLSNAVKFTEKGKIEIAAHEVDGMMEIRVKDTGIGIKEEDMPRLFKSFVRLDTPLRTIIPGTGLGLYLTKKLATEVLKGSVSVESKYGEGSTFVITVAKRIA